MTLEFLIGIALIAVAILFNATFFALGQRFEYPDILRQPTGDILHKFHAGGVGLVRLWYLFMISALLLMPVVLLVAYVFSASQPTLALVSALIGVIAAFVQAMGLIRWSFLVPVLSRRYHDPATSATARESIEGTFEAFHTFMGVAIGEHLGYLFTATWTALVSIMMFQSPDFGALLGALGLVAAVGIFVGLFEAGGFKPAGAINAIAYLVWSLWLIAAGIALIV